MSDLISRKAVIDFIDSHKTFTAYQENGVNKSTNNYVNAALLNGFISNLPASYDVDKVVEQLEEKTALAFKRAYDTPTYSPCYERYSAQYSARKEFLEIVKAGGV